jgi:hypothetical protein
MFCLLNQALARIDHLIRDAVVTQSRMKEAHGRGGDSRWKVEARSYGLVPWGLCLSLGAKMNKLLFLLLLTLPSCAVVTTSDPQWEYPRQQLGHI